jgi:hypothetical protein
MNGTGITVGIFMIMLILLVLSFRLSLVLARREICRVITIFRTQCAVDYQQALLLEAFGLGPRPFFSFRLLRDYKPWALQTLVQAGVIRMATQGNFYLSEETLKANPQIATSCQIK